MADVKKILVVDDHFEMLEFLQSMLELSEYDYDVLAVPSAEEGMLELGRTEFDLLITDIRLPGMSGFEFVRRARRRLQNQSVPVIMMTAHSSEEGRKEAEELGVVHYFMKPFADTDEVLTAVNSVLYGPPPKAEVSVADVSHIDISLPASVKKRLHALTVDTSAALILLVTRYGQMLLQTGAIRDVNTQQMAAIIASNLTNSKQLTQQLGGDVITTIQYHAGDRLEMYTANIGHDYFLSIIFDVQVRRGRFGTIWVFTQRAIKDLQPVLPALPTSKSAAPAPAAPAQKVIKQPPPPRSRRKKRAAKSSSSRPSKARPSYTAPRERPSYTAPKERPSYPKERPSYTPSPTKPSKPKKRRRPLYNLDSASAGNIERAAKLPPKDAPPKKNVPKPSAPPPPSFFVDGDQDAASSNDNEAAAIGIDDLKALLGESTNNDLADLLVGDVPDDDAISFGDEVNTGSLPPLETKSMSFAEAQKLGLVGGAILPKADIADDPLAAIADSAPADEVDLDDFWNTAVSTTEKKTNSGGLSLEEARRQGLIP